ncbi:Uncharacterised protein [Mycobacterium tuberculosis]|nr:Uncharacterised protein [Mycobacterium tuberculosis]
MVEGNGVYRGQRQHEQRGGLKEHDNLSGRGEPCGQGADPR